MQVLNGGAVRKTVVVGQYTSAADPGLSNGSGNFSQPQPFDPGQSSGGSNTRSGGS